MTGSLAFHDMCSLFLLLSCSPLPAASVQYAVASLSAVPVHPSAPCLWVHHSEAVIASLGFSLTFHHHLAMPFNDLAISNILNGSLPLHFILLWSPLSSPKILADLTRSLLFLLQGLPHAHSLLSETVFLDSPRPLLPLGSLSSVS